MRNVFCFTLTQLCKSKANRITFGILLIVVLASMPVASLLLGDGGLLSGALDGVSGAPQIFVQSYTWDEYQDLVLEQAADASSNYATRYGVQYVYSMIVMMVVLFAITYIIRSVIEEKTSKLVETMLVSIRAEDLIFGKILAVLVFITAMMIALGVAAGVSFLVSMVIGGMDFLPELLASTGFEMGDLNIGAELVIVILVSMALAYLLFALIAAMPAAGASAVEDLDSASLLGTFCVLGGFFVASIGLPLMSRDLVVFFSLCPVVSAFAAPGSYILGEISFGLLAASWGIQILCIFWLYKVSGRVYDQLIMYQGNRLKLGTVFKIALGRKGV